MKSLAAFKLLIQCAMPPRRCEERSDEAIPIPVRRCEERSDEAIPMETRRRPLNITCNNNHLLHFLIILLALSVLKTTQARVINVPDDYETIQQAIIASEDGDLVQVEHGTYVENINFNGKNIVVQGDPDHPEDVIIDGDEYDSVVSIINDETDASISGFTIQNGYAEALGCGILCNGTSPILLHLILSRNVSISGGIIHCINNAEVLLNEIIISDNTGSGVVCLDNSNVTIRNSTIRNGDAIGVGGASFGVDCRRNSECEIINVEIANNSDSGINCYQAAMTITDCNISGNSNNGGVFSNGSTIVMENVVISNNAGWRGGGITCLEESVISITEGVIQDNTTENPFYYYGGSGGGIQCDQSELVMEQVTVTENSASRSGGGIWIYYSDANMTNVSISNNTCSSGEGGGIHCNVSTLQLSSVGINENVSSISGGGIFLNGSNQLLTNVTISGNRAGEDGGGIFLQSGAESTFISSILWHNDPQGVYFSRNNDYNTLTVNYSCVEGGENIQHRQQDEINWGEGNIDEDPMFIDPDEGDFRLNEDSPCIDAGDPDAEEDIDGTRADMGAFPFDQREPYIDISVNQESLDFGAVSLANSEEIALTITNAGNRALIIPSISVQGACFSVEFDGEFALGEHENRDVTVIFAPVGQDQVYEGTLTITSNDPNEGELDVNLIGWGIIGYNIELSPGWNMISSPLIPYNPNMPEIWASIVQANNLILMKNQDGQFYWPEGNFNNMADWEIEQGYQMKIRDENILTIQGVTVEPDHPIQLREGWSIAAYFPEESVDYETALANITDQVLQVKDNLGRFWLPRWGWGNLGYLERGQGYKIKVSEDVELVWNVEERLMAVEPTLGAVPVHFLPCLYSGSSMSVLVNSLAPSIDAELGVFSEQGECVGSVTISNSSVGLAVWGDDPSTEENAGASDGERLTFRIWNGNQEILADYKILEGKAEFMPDDVLVIELATSLTPLDCGFTDIHPNPFNSIISLSYSVDVLQSVSLKVFDVAGREVVVLQSSETEAGIHQMTWNATGFQSGVYFVKLEAGDKTQVRKVVLVR